MSRRRSGFIIGGVSSGVGKTLFTLAMMEALRKRGFDVQPFKAGPDYIDPLHHSALLKKPSYNLDTWMMGVEGVRKTFSQKGAGAISVIEGVMGLFDGRDGKSEEGSTAHLSKVLNLPVLLIIDARRMARSAGAIVKGFESYDPGVDLKWAVFNNVASPAHFQMLKDSVPKGSRVKVAGWLPRDGSLAMPSRHLGLITPADMRRGVIGKVIKKAAGLLEAGVDIDTIIKTVSPGRGTSHVKDKNEKGKIRIAVARDNAFCFYYQENLETLEALGAQLVFFSPLKDKRLPKGIKGIYLGGGYPELYASELEKNIFMREAILGHSSSGVPVFAECGGLMYLGRSIISGKKQYRMSGVFPWTARLHSKRQGLGYREVSVVDDCNFMEKGSIVRGHEFHYSSIALPKTFQVKRTFLVSSRSGESLEGYSRGNTLATYVHLHFASNPAFVEGFVRACRKSGLKPAGLHLQGKSASRLKKIRKGGLDDTDRVRKERYHYAGDEGDRVR